MVRVCSRAEIKGPHGRMTKKYSQIDQKTETEKIVSSSFGLLFDAGGDASLWLERIGNDSS